MSSKEYNIAIAGVTGAVGRVFLQILEQRKFPINNLVPLASSRSAGKTVTFAGEEIEVRELNKDSFKGIDIALFSAGASRSKEYAKYAVDSGAIVVDNSSAFRLEDDVPLIVPEVNRKDIEGHKGIIANPNCTTIIMVVAVKPIYDISPVKRIVVSTYQSVSGAGASGMTELEDQLREIICNKNSNVTPETFPVQIANNVIPHIDVFYDNGYTKEEMKLVHETMKLFGLNKIKITATAARVPVFYGHSESVYLETKKHITIKKLKNIYLKKKGIKLVDDIDNIKYPLAIMSEIYDDVMVGRLRKDLTEPNGINMWIVANNLRKGAALNAVQIAELLI